MVTIGGPFTKQPSEVLDYGITLVRWFAKKGDADDHIESVVADVSGSKADPDLVLGPGVLPEYTLLGSPVQQLKVWVGGGVHGRNYTVTLYLTTHEGRKLEVDFVVKVREKTR